MSRFEGKFGIPASHPTESLLTSALYRLPDSVNPEYIQDLTQQIAEKVNQALRYAEMPHALSLEEIKILQLKLARHYEDNGDSAHVDIPTFVDALVESPKFLKNDRGSVMKLFEIHEVKTLQRIAELRRKKAEQTHDESLNPYENLFETDSGQFYIARLLNMPHLEDESQYMGHCVGTSDSYVNKMKKGDVEIFSLRDTATHSPIVTIEYDRRARRLLQVKSQSDRIPTLADDFSSDLIQALDQLQHTKDDTRELREIRSTEVADLRALLSLQEKQSQSAIFTREELIFLYEVERPITGFDVSAREPLITKLRAGRDIEEDMLVIFDCTRAEIAHVPSEITENTRAYVGQLEPGIFQKLPDTLEHIYTTFPDKKIRRDSVEIGGQSVEQLLSEMAGAHINISDYAKSMLESKDFSLSKVKESVALVRLTVSDLGFSGVVTTDEIYKRGAELGLELCPSEVGPQYRLKYQDQPLKEWFRIAMKQISDSVGYPSRFYLVRSGDGVWLDNDPAGPDSRWGPRSEFVFALRKKS